MPFSPVEKNWRSQREMVVLENGIEYYDRKPLNASNNAKSE